MLLGVALVLAVLWICFEGLGLRLSWVSAPVPFVAYPEPAGAQARPRSGNGELPRNMVVFVADGLGFAHLALAQHSFGRNPVWHEFEVRGWHDPRPIEGSVTDSAASATAIATGRTTLNDRVGLDENGRPMRSLFELAWEAGYRTGIVTDFYIWDATPAAFVTHTASRDNARDILEQLAAGQLEILMGELKDMGEAGVPTTGPCHHPNSSGRFQGRYRNLTTPSYADSIRGYPARSGGAFWIRRGSNFKLAATKANLGKPRDAKLRVRESSRSPGCRRALGSVLCDSS